MTLRELHTCVATDNHATRGAFDKVMIILKG